MKWTEPKKKQINVISIIIYHARIYSILLCWIIYMLYFQYHINRGIKHIIFNSLLWSWSRILKSYIKSKKEKESPKRVRYNNSSYPKDIVKVPVSCLHGKCDWLQGLILWMLFLKADNDVYLDILILFFSPWSQRKRDKVKIWVKQVIGLVLSLSRKRWLQMQKKYRLRLSST
jgi:cadmium resistance protein CadD (predicted permease)